MSIGYTNVPIPDATELALDNYMPQGMTFGELVTKRGRLKKLIKECEDEITKTIDPILMSVLNNSGNKTVAWNNEYAITKKEGAKPRQILDRILLLEAGVSPEQIQAGTKMGKPTKPCIMVRPLGEKEEYDTSYGAE